MFLKFIIHNSHSLKPFRSNLTANSWRVMQLHLHNKKNGPYINNRNVISISILLINVFLGYCLLSPDKTSPLSRLLCLGINDNGEKRQCMARGRWKTPRSVRPARCESVRLLRPVCMSVCVTVSVRLPGLWLHVCVSVPVCVCVSVRLPDLSVCAPTPPGPRGAVWGRVWDGFSDQSADTRLTNDDRSALSCY